MKAGQGGDKVFVLCLVAALGWQAPVTVVLETLQCPQRQELSRLYTSLGSPPSSRHSPSLLRAPSPFLTCQTLPSPQPRFTVQCLDSASALSFDSASRQSVVSPGVGRLASDRANQK